jgi:hypothetical protein
MDILGGRRTKLIPPRRVETSRDFEQSATSEADPTLPYSNTSVTAVTPATPAAKPKRGWSLAVAVIGAIMLVAVVLWQIAVWFGR